MAKLKLVTRLRAEQDCAAQAMRAANCEPAWRKGARASFDTALRAWLRLGAELAALGDYR